MTLLVVDYRLHLKGNYAYFRRKVDMPAYNSGLNKLTGHTLNPARVNRLLGIEKLGVTQLR